MAFQKTITLENGTSGNYLKITKLNLDKLNLKLTIQLSLYLNVSKKDSVPIKEGFKHFKVDISKEQSCSNLLQFAYNEIKSEDDPDLTEIIDV